MAPTAIQVITIINITINKKRRFIMAKMVKIGTRIKHTTFGGRELYEGTITSIEKCKRHEKYGRPVSSARLDIDADTYTLCLDNGKWCYGSQVVSIIK